MTLGSELRVTLMSKRKYQRLIPLLLLAAVSMAVIAAGAEDQTTEPDSNVMPPEQSVQTPSEPVDKASEVPATEEKAPTDSEDAAAPTPIKEFKPTDTIEADSAVSFPIDI